ncbi:MAG: G1 family glutamic endopeptidase [Acidimicrobiales bacterium]
MGRADYLLTGSSRHVPLPTSGPPPIPGEGPDLPRWNHGSGHVNARATRPSTSNGLESTRIWSGLVDTGTTYTSVAGHWTVPLVQPSTTQKAVATWVGISGFHEPTLIQTGTTASTRSGSTAYSAWYELIPAPPIGIPEPVSPGDEMAAVIKQTGVHTWHIGIQDVTRGWVAARTVTYTAGPASSAEWITERPTTSRTTTFITLADYGSSRFHDLRVSGTDLTATSITSTYMTNTTTVVISYPSKFASSTTGSFTDYYGTPLPTVTSVSPSQGGTSGGTQVTISGTYIVPTLTKSVHFGADAAHATINSDGTITATSPAEAAGSVDVTVTTTDGTSAVSSADTFIYVAPTTTTPPKSTTPPKTTTPPTTTTPPKTTTPTTTPPKATTPPSATATGYDLVGADGGVFVFDAPGQSGGFYGSLPGIHVVPSKPVVGMVATANDKGYFLVAQDGGVFSFGNAPFLGSLPGIGVTPAQPITGLVATGTDQGYFLVGRDGGVFSFGNAPFLGSLPGEGIHVDDIVGIAATPSGNGYWLVASTGQVYAFGAAAHLGTALGTPSAVSAIAGTPTGGGYWITTKDGAVYAFGAAKSFGTLPASHVTPSLPVVGIVHTAGTGGYWLLGADGGIFAFGDAPFYGSLPGIGVHVTDIVGAVPN